MNDSTLRIGVFASGRGSNLQAIINSIEAGELICKIEFVLSNNSDSGALEIARRYNIPAIHLSERNFHSDNFESSFFQVLRKYNPDLIILAGYMKLIPQNVVTEYCNRIINIHPALLPNFGGKGMFGMNVHNAVFESKEKYSGVSVHLVNEEYDKGKVLFQEKVDISDCKSPEEIAEKVLKLEHVVYPKVLKMIYEKKMSLL
ncbi:MAG: phosphoribosylglycinamide formyltransferase [Bacteroidetes bacterium]|nr:phosphoribosylglycinamide formyltransferase [Bacteroidota bacterium]MBU2584395.1 phosphoribosylglycinamide formyltransferase [Bacteroidota bacterium]